MNSLMNEELATFKAGPHIKFAIKVKLDEGAQMPQKRYEADAGADVYAYESVVINPSETVAVKTGVYLSIPQGYEVQVRSRSGLALNSGIFVLTGVGTIDSGYHGEIKVILHNISKVPFTVHRGDRIAQLVVSALPNLPVVMVENFDKSERGEGGVGSTGMR